MVSTKEKMVSDKIKYDIVNFEMNLNEYEKSEISNPFD